MNDILDAAGEALRLIASLDPHLVEIVCLSLRVSLAAVVISSLLGLPLGGILAVARFPGRSVAAVVLNGLMGTPPVVVGLVVYLLVSRSGPLGVLGLLFSPAAMILAQSILALPIVASLSRQVVADLWEDYGEQLRSLGARTDQSVRTLLWDARVSLATAGLAGFGRAIGEVGAVMIVGGNIDHATRVMTSAIALETSKGDFALALGLGIILLVLAIGVNAAAYGIAAAGRHAHLGPAAGRRTA
ncbi:MAG: ABC transporter permease [Acidobacteriota bacterium]